MVNKDYHIKLHLRDGRTDASVRRSICPAVS